MINILAVDDDLDFQEILKIKLPSTEYNLTLTTTEQEFFEQMDKGNFDIFLIDLSLDNHPLKGLEIIIKIRQEKNKDKPIIVLSNNSAKKTISNALEIGASDFVSKPVDGKLLKTKITALVQGNQAYSKELEFGKPSEKQPNVLLVSKLRLLAITELGFLIEGNAFVAKGSKIKLSSPRIQEIYGQNSIEVYSTGFNSEVSGVYVTAFEIDPENKEMVNKTKLWIKANQP